MSQSGSFFPFYYVYYSPHLCESLF